MSYNNNRRPNNGSKKNFSNFHHSKSGFGNNRRPRRQRPERGIDPSLYTQSANPQVTKTYSSQHTFDNFNFHPSLAKEVERRGYKQPTEIQEMLIPKIMDGQDVVAISQTGSGKTAAFVLPLLNRCLDESVPREDKPTLILVPTRELAYQVEKELNSFGLRQFRFFALVCIGGTDIRRQMKFASKHNEFLIATPGRLIDLAERGVIDLSKFKTLIVDEMDRMLDMGFIDDITWIIDQMPANKQSGFFSATMNSKIDPILERFAPGVERTRVNHPKPSEFVDQSMVRIDRGQNKIDVLVELLAQSPNKSIVFVNTKAETERVFDILKSEGHQADYIHGDRNQSSRTRVIKKYTQQNGGVLVATDVAARGIDIDDVTHVFNYDEPHSYEDYIHRIGRTGRAGKFGKAVTLVKR